MLSPAEMKIRYLIFISAPFQVQPRRKESLLTCLADLFNSIATQKKKVGVIPPKKFISRLRKENGDFLIFHLHLSKPFFPESSIGCLYWQTWVEER